MFPLLYGKSKSGKIKTWCISIIRQDLKTLVITRHGYIDGQIIETCKEITKGKNLGKKNQTTHFEQAQLEAQSKWNKKIEEGYSEKQESIKELSLPMLAHKFEDHKNKIIYPCYVQPKKDGIRCIYNGIDKVLYTRTGKIINNVNSILIELKNTGTNLLLDGELINEDIPFEKFAGIMNKKKINTNDLSLLQNVKFYIFDTISFNVEFEKRFNIILNSFFKHKFNNIYLLKTEVANKETDIYNFHKQYVKEGNEGIIVRNANSLYETNYRSYNLLKYKTFIDNEYKIINFTEGNGNEKGCVIWICETPNGHIFDVRPRGTFDERKILYKNGNKYIGKYLTVRYQELFDNTDKPRFGIGLAIRDYD